MQLVQYCDDENIILLGAPTIYSVTKVQRTQTKLSFAIEFVIVGSIKFIKHNSNELFKVTS